MEKKQKRRFLRAVLLLALFAAIGYTVYGTITKDEVNILKVGDKAPDFSLVDMNGKEHRISQYTAEGKGVFLNFWGTWCEPCEREMPAMERQYKTYIGEDYEMIAVNIDQTVFEVKNYIKQQNMSFPVVIDRNRSIMDLYNIGPLPTTILIGSDGKIKKFVKGEMTDQAIAQYIESILPENNS